MEYGKECGGVTTSWAIRIILLIVELQHNKSMQYSTNRYPTRIYTHDYYIIILIIIMIMITKIIIIIIVINNVTSFLSYKIFRSVMHASQHIAQASWQTSWSVSMVGFPLHSQDWLCWVGSLESCCLDYCHCLACLGVVIFVVLVWMSWWMPQPGVLYFFYTFDHPELSQGMIEAR